MLRQWKNCNIVTPSEILDELIRIPSVNPMGGEADSETCYEHRISDWLERFFDSIGAQHERIEAASGRDNIIARYDADRSQPTILLDAHQDTVPVVGMPQPFDPQHRDGRIYGRGACDVKGGMAAMLFAFARLVNERPAGAANVILSCSCDEEANMTGVVQLLTYWMTPNSKSRLITSQPDVCVVAEPTDLNVVVAHLGVVRFRVRTHGLACHASDPSLGRNAIYAMTPVLQLLEQYAKDLSASNNAHPLCGRPTLSVGLIHGGTAVNIVPAECLIEIDRRLVPGEDPRQVWEHLNQSLSPLADVQCESPWLAAPSLSDRDNGSLADQLVAVARSAGAQGCQKVGVAYCTNASTIGSAGVPAVVFGPGSIAQAHTANEFVDVSQLNVAADVYFRFCATQSPR